MVAVQAVVNKVSIYFTAVCTEKKNTIGRQGEIGELDRFCGSGLQNIDAVFLSRTARLRGELDRIFGSVSVCPWAAKDIVRLLYTRDAGFTRRETIKQQGISDGQTVPQTQRTGTASSPNTVAEAARTAPGGRSSQARLVEAGDDTFVVGDLELCASWLITTSQG